jgi:hypothetical protein
MGLAVEVIVEFIRDHADRTDGDLRSGVEPICAVLTEELGVKIALSTYYEHLLRRPSVRDRRGERMSAHIARATPRTTASTMPARWLALNRKGIPVPGARWNADALPGPGRCSEAGSSGRRSQTRPRRGLRTWWVAGYPPERRIGSGSPTITQDSL